MFKFIFCRVLCWHSFHTSPDGMTRYCTTCSQWELNTNLSFDPIKRWRIASYDEVYDFHQKQLDKGKYI